MSYKPGTIWVTLSLLLKLQQGTIVIVTKCGTGLNLRKDHMMNYLY